MVHPSARRVTFDQLVTRLRRELTAGRVTFLVGAGVSMLPPTYLPSGPRLRDVAVRALCDASPLRTQWQALSKNGRYREMVPEVAFQSMDDCIGSKVSALFDVLRGMLPNHAHAMLAAALTARVVTTNFDLLIEHFGRRDVVHLHGSLDDVERMVVRINQVGRGIEHTLRREVRTLVRGRVLCVLGYSGNDLDVAAAVVAARPSAILWLTRNELDSAWGNMTRFVSGGPSTITAAIGDLDLLARRVGAVPPAAGRGLSERQARTRETRFARQWGRTLTQGERLCAVAALLYSAEDYARAGDTAIRAAAASARDRSLKALALNIVAAARSIEGRYDEAIAAARRTVDSSGVPAFERATAFSALANAWLYRDDYDAGVAARYARRALREIQRVPLGTVSEERLRVVRGSIYNRLGLALEFVGAPREAAKYLRLSVTDRRAGGDLKGLATSASNLSLAHYAARDYSRAAYWRRVAMNLLEKYGLAFEQAYLLRRWGVLAEEQGRRSQGIKLVRRALNLYESIPTAKFGQRHTRQILRNFGVTP